MYAIHHVGGAVVVRKMPKAEAEAYVAHVNGNAPSGAFPERARLATGSEARVVMEDRLLDRAVFVRRADVRRLSMSVLMEVFNDRFA